MYAQQENQQQNVTAIYAREAELITGAQKQEIDIGREAVFNQITAREARNLVRFF